MDDHRTSGTRYRLEIPYGKLLLQGPWYIATYERLFWSHLPGIPCSHSSRTALRHQGMEPLSEAQLVPLLTLQPRGSFSNLGGSLFSSPYSF